MMTPSDFREREILCQDSLMKNAARRCLHGRRALSPNPLIDFRATFSSSLNGILVARGGFCAVCMACFFIDAAASTPMYYLLPLLSANNVLIALFELEMRTFVYSRACI